MEKPQLVLTHEDWEMQCPCSYSDGLVRSESRHLLVAAALALRGSSQSTTARQGQPEGAEREKSPRNKCSDIVQRPGARGEHTAVHSPAHTTWEREGAAGISRIVQSVFSRFQFPFSPAELPVTLRAELKSYTQLDMFFPLVSC